MDVDEAASPPDVKLDLAEEADDQQDPNEPLRIADLTQTWSVKVPEEILEQWNKVTIPGAKLGKIKIFQPSGKMRLYVPNPNADPDDPNPPTIAYEMQLVNRQVKDTLVVTDEPKYPGTDKRDRVNILRGALEHDVQIPSRLTNDYADRMRERRTNAEPEQRIVVLDKDNVDQAEINRLNAGVIHTGGKKNLPNAFSTLTKPTKSKGTFERMARKPKNEVIDMLFNHFKQQQYWSFKELRTNTQQPEVYLKELLNEIGHLERSGPNNGMWRALDSYGIVAPGMKDEEEGDSDPGTGPTAFKMDPSLKVEPMLGYPAPAPNTEFFDYGEPDDDDDDDEDEDMEEVE